MYPEPVYETSPENHIVKGKAETVWGDGFLLKLRSTWEAWEIIHCFWPEGAAIPVQLILSRSFHLLHWLYSANSFTCHTLPGFRNVITNETPSLLWVQLRGGCVSWPDGCRATWRLSPGEPLSITDELQVWSGGDKEWLMGSFLRMMNCFWLSSDLLSFSTESSTFQEMGQSLVSGHLGFCWYGTLGVSQEGTIESIASPAREIAIHNRHSKNVGSIFWPRFQFSELGLPLNSKWVFNEFVAW